jgi:hypothetical protein
MAANTAFGYTILSRSYVEQALPRADPFIGQLDTWTENATLWTSAPRARITEDFNDFINGKFYGNRSIAFSINNTSQIFMELMNIGPVNCSGPDSYKNLSLRIKIVDPKTMPSNAYIYLFSGKNSNYFYHNLTDILSSSKADIWNNLTIPLATESWVNNNADWSNITGMRLEFGWLENLNITMLADGLYFRGVFQTPIKIDAVGYLLSISISGFLQFVLQWVFTAGIIFIVVKAFGAKTAWKPILISVGFAFIILFVQAIINTVVALSTLQNLYYSLEYLGGTSSEMAIATAKMNDQTLLFSTINSYMQIAILIWITVLCAIANRLLTGLSWAKSVLSSGLALFIAYMISSLFGV